MNEKTMAERCSYIEQEKIFIKIDRFYQRLWQSVKVLNE